MAHTDMEMRREEERKKYLALLKTKYGSSNHGSIALPEILALRPKPRFLVDFGCGRNDFVRELRSTHGIPAAGVDFAFPEADVHRPMHETGIQSCIADVVTAFDSLEHLLEEDVFPVLREMRRVGCPGARFWVTVCCRPSKITVAGRNLHPTVKSIDWWIARFTDIGALVHTGEGSFQSPRQLPGDQRWLLKGVFISLKHE